MKNSRFALVLLVSAVGGCASIIDGTSQEIAVNTTPPGATCRLMRQGEQIGIVSPTPGATTVSKTKYEMQIVCDRENYETATYLNKSGFSPVGFGNLVLGGGIAFIVDSATGADNKYQSPVTIPLVPRPAAYPGTVAPIGPMSMQAPPPGAMPEQPYRR